MQSTAANRPTTQEWLSYARRGEVLVNLGQFSARTIAALEREVKAGRLASWRGKWFPQAGAPWGIGPDKTCYGLPAVRDHFVPQVQP